MPFRTLTIATTLTLLAGCVPTTPSAGPDLAGTIASACKQAGGTMKPVGRMQTMQCVIACADVGKSCSSGDQCAGDCRADSAPQGVAGQPLGRPTVAGTRQPTSDRFGCHAKVENGRAQATVCID